ncbi:MAG: glycosyltransferase [Gammaproteobacteria bacterium]|nr:glycosyltransferase [Gammaproteobacteria bacterium]MDH3768221.1 glycosyltransferase [Gammaproteobacteria bacterium]
MKLLVIEPEASGHRMALYVRLIAREAIRRNWSFLLMTTEKAMRHPAFELVKSECVDGPAIVRMSSIQPAKRLSPMHLLLSQNQYYQSTAAAYRTLSSNDEPDMIYVANLDMFDKILPFRGTPFGETPFSGMMMSIKFHRRHVGTASPRGSDRLFGHLFKRAVAIPELRGVAVVDESFLEYTKHHTTDTFTKVHYVPDVGHLKPSESQHDARQKLGIPADKFVVLVYGGLTARKGVSQLITATQATNRNDVAILLAGVKNQNIANELLSSPARSLVESGRLFQSCGFHDELKEQRVFRSANAVWLGYIEGFTGSSGVMYQAGAAGLPVISTRHGLIGWQTERHRLGPTVDPMDSNEIVRAIEMLVTDKSLCQQYSRNGYALARSHTPEAFGTGVCSMLDSLL